MSVFTIVNSAALVASTAAFPRSVSTTIYGAIGNQFTCSMQGFLLSLGVAGPLYGGMLCINYLLVIKYNISDDVLKSYEKYLHAVALIPTISFALFGVFSDIFHPSLKMICWAAYGCELDYVADPNSDCEPKNQLKSDIVKFSMVGLGLSGVIITLYSMISLYISVRHQSMQMKKYQSWRAISQKASLNRVPRCKDDQRGPSDETFAQALLYVLMYLFCSIFVVMAQFVKEIGFTLMILKAIFYPSTGIWNLIIYVRPRFVAIRKNRKKESFWWVMKIIFKGGNDYLKDQERKRKKNFMLKMIRTACRRISTAEISDDNNDVYDAERLSLEDEKIIRHVCERISIKLERDGADFDHIDHSHAVHRSSKETKMIREICKRISMEAKKSGVDIDVDSIDSALEYGNDSISVINDTSISPRMTTSSKKGTDEIDFSENEGANKDVNDNSLNGNEFDLNDDDDENDSILISLVNDILYDQHILEENLE
eukprot:CAMPEP_0178908638 /NCGR_PEP_ID=MMETSP0786-20121207/8034_1 /TAXON_ID=186022 /ORGANISM="Thalassionema frauenfeldii, Strain CCMP 1798" /LENGTH=483 /DNA_ID=CAMNT_0020580563 /DNA_START=1 /DNA_END=1452 /DNA_ORIENTATION=+